MTLRSSIIIEASAASANGVGAHFQLLLDGVAIGNVTVANTAPASYAFTADLDPAVPHTITVLYDNDAVANGDRNLFVKSIALNGTVIQASSQATTYVPDYGLQPRSGTGDLYWGGKLSATFPAAAATTAIPVTTTPVTTTPAAATTTTTVPPAGTVSVTLSGTSAGGVPPHFQLLVDGTVIGSGTVADGAAQTLSFAATVDPAKAHLIRLAYDNDGVANGADRNLFVQSIAVNGQTYKATDSTAVYHANSGQGDHVGSGSLYWGGNLDFSVPATASATTPVTTTPVVTTAVTATPVVTTPVATAPVTTTPSTATTVPAGTVSVTLSGTSAGGVPPHFQLLVDGTVIGSGTVADGAAQTLSFAAAVDPAKAHLIRLAYDNDGVANGADRNLFVQSIAVNGQTYKATDSTAVYHANSGQGDHVGSGNLYWGGNLDFSVPATGSTAAVTATTPVTTPVVTPVVTPVTTPIVTPVTTPAGFYVSTSGSDTADGSAARPFATLNRARIAMEGSSVHTTYVLGGAYTPGAALVLGAADSGMAFIAASGSTPVLDGKGSLPTLITLNGATGVTLQGLTFKGASGSGLGAVTLKNASGNNIVANSFDGNANGIVLAGSSGNLVLNNAINHSAASAVEAKDGSNGNTFASNSIDGTGALAQSGGGFFLHGVNDNTITHNLVQNTAGVGIGIENWDGTTINVGNTVTYNVVRNTSTQSQDSGAIYILGRSHVDTKAVVANNLIDGTGAGGDAHTIGIYLDDSTSGVTVQNNVVRHIGTHGVEVHGGDNNVITNNIFDLGSTATSAVLFQAAPADTNPTNTMLGNVVSGNIITASGRDQTAYTDLIGGHPTVTRNLYTGLTPAQVTSTLIGDSNPAYGSAGFIDAANGNYTLVAGSTAASAIGFRPIDTSVIGVQALPASWAR